MLALLPVIIVFLGSILLFSGVFLPWITVASYLVFRPFIQPFAWLQYKLFGLPIAFPFSLIVIALGLLLPLMRKRWSPTVEKSGFFILFMIVAFLSIGFTDYMEETAAALIKLLTVWFLYNIAYNAVQSRDDALHIIDALIISSVMPLLFGFYQAITGNYDLIYDAEVDRISSVFVTGNDYGIFLTFVTAAVAVRLTISTSRRTRLLMLGVLAMILISQILSLNRGTWLALAMGFMVAATKYRRYINFKLFIAGGVVFAFLFAGKIINRFQELDDPSLVHYTKTSTLEGRIAYWRDLVPIISERPIQGYGFGSGTTIIEKRLGKEHKPHNDYLLIFLEMGIFGVLAYIAFLGRIFIYFFFRRVSEELWVWNFGMLMLTVYFIIISGAQNIVQSILNFPIYLILVGIVFRLNRIAVSKAAAQKPVPLLGRQRLTGKERKLERPNNRVTP